MSTLKRNPLPFNPQLVQAKEVVIQLEKLSDSVVVEMTERKSTLQLKQVQ